MKPGKLPIALVAIFWLGLCSLPTAQAQLNVVVGGDCPTIGGPVTCTQNGTHDGKPKFTGTSSNNKAVTVQWDNTPPRWFILFDGASYFQSSLTTNLPPASGQCSWTIGADLPASFFDELCFLSFSVTGSGTVSTNCSWDGDGDGLPVFADNCNNVANPGQDDNDFDNVGNACDNCPNLYNPYQQDSDSDGTGDLCDGCPNDPNKTAPGACGCGVPDPVPGTLSGTTSVCIGGTTQLSSNGDPGGTWTSSNTTVAMVNASGLVSALTNGTSTITYTVTEGSCSISTSIVVTVNPPPAVSCPASSAVCSSTAPFALSGGSPAGGTYSGPGVSGGVFSPAVAGVGTHIITYSATQGGCSGSCTFTITVNAAPTAGVLTAPGFTQGSNGWQVCFGNTMQMVSSGTSGGTWVANNPGIISITSSGGLVTPLTGNPFNTDSSTVFYRVTVAGCPTVSSNTRVEVRGGNPGTISGSAAVCNGSSTQYTSNGQGGGTWMSSNMAVATVSATGLVTGVGAGMATISYTVTSEGCSNSATKVITVNALPNTTITVAENSGTTPNDGTICAGASATLNGSGGGTYAWSNGANTAAITVTPSGTTTYSVTVTNASGCTATATRTITVNPLPTPGITVSENSGTTPNDGTICSGDVATLTASGGTSYVWSMGATSNVVNVSPTATTTYTVTVTNANGCSATSTYTVVVQTCGGGPIAFSGKILFSNNTGLGVNNANVALMGSATGSDLTDVNGDYAISTTATSGTFTLTPTKTANKLNGVTAADATAIQQHAGNITLITDLYKQVAADVNKSNSITSVDASIITQSLLGNPSALSQFKTSWRFVPTSHTMTSPPWGFPEKRTYTGISTSQTNQDFYGIKTGDVVTTFANPANLSSSTPLVFRTQDQPLQSGETISVVFQTDQWSDLAAVQAAFVFDPAYLQFETVAPAEGGLPFTEDHFGTFNIDEGELRMVWAQATGIQVAEAAPAFILQFKALQSGAMLSDVLQLDNEILPALCYAANLDESTVQLQYSVSTSTNNPAAGDALNLRVQPNPFVQETTVTFHLPESCEAQLRVYDLNGRELLRVKNTYPAGSNYELLNLGAAFGSGVYYCELTTPFGVVTRKMTSVR